MRVERKAGLPSMAVKAKQRSPLAQWLYDVRANIAKLTQAEFAKRLRVHTITVSSWERDKYALRWAAYQRIRALFPDAPPAPGMLPTALAAEIAAARPRTMEAAEIAGIVDGEPLRVREYMRDAIYRMRSRTLPPKNGAGKRTTYRRTR